jgi:hypothetical protein
LPVIFHGGPPVDTQVGLEVIILLMSPMKLG